MRTPLLIAGTAVAALVLAGCSSTPTAESGRVQIVASTDVYGSIASAIAGDLADVTSIIDSAAQDPHSYEASPQDQLALSKADLVIENGGGYDPFIDTMLDASGSDEVVVVNASEASGLLEGDAHSDGESAEEGAEEHSEDDGHDHIEGFNEHVWYSPHGAEHIAEHVAEELSELDETNASTYAANLAEFIDGIAALEARLDALAAQTIGLGAAITEPVPLYLLLAAGFTNVTPDAFSEAIEEGTDVAPAALQQTLDTVTGPDVALLAYNAQTAGTETEQVREAVEAAGIPVVEFTETLPVGDDYLSWMASNVDAIEAALAT